MKEKSSLINISLTMEGEELKKRVNEFYGVSSKVDDEIKRQKEREELDKIKYELGMCYELMEQIYRKNTHLPEKEYYKIILWTIGTYFHSAFPTYPILYLNATKGSGKSRTMSLTTYLSKEGSMCNNMTEAVLFRSKGTLGIDEFENLTRKGSEALNELINSCYKRGVKVKRMRKLHTPKGEEQVVEEFDLYRPVIMANINGIGNVLEDRCIVLSLDKSNNPSITKRFELWEDDSEIQQLKINLDKISVVSAVSVVLCQIRNVYKGWNIYLDSKYTTTLTTLSTLSTLTTLEEENLSFYNKIDQSGISGRNLELSMPLLILANIINEDLFEKMLQIMVEYDSLKKDDDFIENYDNAVIDFVSQYPNTNFIWIKRIVQEFKEFSQINDEWINEKWMGKALKRLNLVLEKKRLHHGKEVRLDISKAQEKVRMLK